MYFGGELISCGSRAGTINVFQEIFEMEKTSGAGLFWKKGISSYGV